MKNEKKNGNNNNKLKSPRRAKYETSYQLILNSLKPGAHAEHIKTSSSLKFRDFIL